MNPFKKSPKHATIAPTSMPNSNRTFKCPPPITRLAAPTPKVAARAAHRELGNIPLIQQTTRDQRPIATFFDDLAARSPLRLPHSPQKSRLHARRHHHSRSRHRRQHRRLQRHRLRDPPPAPFQKRRPPRLVQRKIPAQRSRRRFPTRLHRLPRRQSILRPSRRHGQRPKPIQSFRRSLATSSRQHRHRKFLRNARHHSANRPRLHPGRRTIRNSTVRHPRPRHLDARLRFRPIHRRQNNPPRRSTAPRSSAYSPPIFRYSPKRKSGNRLLCAIPACNFAAATSSK